MTARMRPYEASDEPRVLEICIAAFAPYFRYLEETMGPAVFALRYHDWRQQYAETMARIPDVGGLKVYVAEEDGAVAGFAFVHFDAARQMGEIGLNAVDPARQGRGIGAMMVAFALDDLKQRGAKAVHVGTGSDAFHARARAAYEHAGFDKVVHGVHYFRDL